MVGTDWKLHSQSHRPRTANTETLSGLQSPSWTVLCVHVQRLLATSAKMCRYVLIDSPGTSRRVGLSTTITWSLRTVLKGRMSESSIIKVLRSGVVVVVVDVFVWERLGGGGYGGGGKRWKMRRYFSMCRSYQWPILAPKSIRRHCIVCITCYFTCYFTTNIDIRL